jgi:hypothetical protein
MRHVTLTTDTQNNLYISEINDGKLCNSIGINEIQLANLCETILSTITQEYKSTYLKKIKTK